MQIEVVYALPTEQVRISVMFNDGLTVKQAIQNSGLLDRYPDINLAQQKVGIFGEIVTLDYKVQAGDRIEIYRPLQIDPMEARRLRAKRTKK